MTPIKVLVHKASLRLMPDESLVEFTEALLAAYRDSRSLGETDWAWPSEIFSDHAVFFVDQGGDSDGFGKHFMVNFERDSDGTFRFENEREVRAVVTRRFVPVTESD